MTEIVTHTSGPAVGKSTTTGRLFVLELSGDRIHSMNPDGSNRRTIVTDCHLPDGIVVDGRRVISIGPIWVSPTSTTARSSAPTSTAGTAGLSSRKASPTRRNRST